MPGDSDVDETSSGSDARFPWAHEVDLPDELDGWRDLYPEFFLFDITEARTEYEHQFPWILDLATTEPLLPWDMTVSGEAWAIGMSQNSGRVLPIPDSISVQFRILAGYAYITEIPCTDQELIEEREAIFAERSEYLFEHYRRLYENQWKPRVQEIGTRVQELNVPEELPRYVPDEVVKESVGRTQTLDVLESYNRLTELALEGWQRHFEFLNLAYIAYMDFFDFCTNAFPGIPDDAIMQMVSGVDVDLYRPDEELADLAHLANELGDPVTAILLSEDTPAEKREQLQDSPAGREFLEAFDEVKDPWFFMSYGDGFHSYHGSWIDDLKGPFSYLRTKLEDLEDGESIDRDIEQLENERRQIAEEYYSYLSSPEERETFEELYARCLNVYEYAEDHQFWIEHRLDTIVFRKMREFGQLLVTHDFLKDPEHIFLFTRFEVAELLTELCEVWALGPTAYTPERWKDRAEERATIMEAAREWEPPPVLGDPPEEINDPILVMLYGVTTEKIESWLSNESPTVGEGEGIQGFAASSGVAEGRARVIRSVDELQHIEDGEVLVSPLTNPSWAPVFPRISAAVTDKGGITSHAAVVCREYGLPAVTGTEVATKRIATGDRIRVDGSSGEIEVIERAD